jgi:hypothetical protein
METTASCVNATWSRWKETDMRRMSRWWAVAVMAIGAGVAEGVTVGPGSYVVLDMGVSDPFGKGGRLLERVTTAGQSVTTLSNISRQPFTRATVSLTTEVYELPGGSLGFAYTITGESFRDPLDRLDFGQALIPQLRVPGFARAPADVNVSRIPTGHGSGPHRMTVYRSEPANDTVIYSFANDSVPANMPAFSSLFANGTITAFAEVEAATYERSRSVLRMMLRDGRSPGVGTFPELMFESLAPRFEAPSGGAIPEPATMGMLALAAGALGWRMRRL